MMGRTIGIVGRRLGRATALCLCLAAAGCGKAGDGEWNPFEGDRREDIAAPPPQAKRPPLVPGSETFFLGPATVPAQEPPPISGGTLTVLADGRTALAADPDRDSVHVVDLEAGRKLATIALQAADEPGRVVEDGAGRVHVALRRGGAVATLARGADGAFTLVGRRSVCAAPRGLTVQAPFGPAGGEALHVACGDGKLVSLASAPDGAVLRELSLERDLRDVVVVGDGLLVSRFKSAEVLRLSADGRISARLRARNGSAGSPAVAWRMRAVEGGALVLHQIDSDIPLGISEGGYGGDSFGPCPSPVSAGLTFIPAQGSPAAVGAVSLAILPVDLAVAGPDRRLALVAAGNKTLPQVQVKTQKQLAAQSCTPQEAPVPLPVSQTPDAGAAADGGVAETDAGAPPDEPLPPPDPIDAVQPVTGRVIAVEFDGRGRTIVQTRDPATVQILVDRPTVVRLASDDHRFASSGHDVFHTGVGVGLACASCHPEGGEDGRVWLFQEIGPRRTQSVRGGISTTAPFHWDGDMSDLGHLMNEVFSKRMGGPALAADWKQALAHYMDGIPALPRLPVTDAAARARGEALFEDATVACATCHGGPHLTNNQSVDVGKQRATQSPSLAGVGWRAPFMHDGCAPDLATRFLDKACGGGDQHGRTSHLSRQQIDDLVTYLDSL